MKIKKGSLVLLLKDGVHGCTVCDYWPLAKCLGMVRETSAYRGPGKGFEVRTFSGKDLFCKEEKLIFIAQIKTEDRKKRLKAILRKYSYGIAKNLAWNILPSHT